MLHGQSDYAAHALVAVDCALWDLKGQALGLPVWKLLGSARSRSTPTSALAFFHREGLLFP